MKQLRILYDLTGNPHNIYIGPSINEVVINPKTYKIPINKNIPIFDKPDATIQELINKYSKEINYRVNIVNSSTNRKENIDSSLTGVSIDSIYYFFQYSCIEVSYGCYQIDIHRIYILKEQEDI